LIAFLVLSSHTTLGSRIFIAGPQTRKNIPAMGESFGQKSANNHIKPMGRNFAL
jgi:hypothetical protein